MKGPPCSRWSCSVQAAASTRPRIVLVRFRSRRFQSAVAAARIEEEIPDNDRPNHRKLPSPPPYLAKSSSRLNALHARLSLPPRFPIETLARCLIDPTADSDIRYNNISFSTLGKNILAYYTSEAVICRYPRLPTQIVKAAMAAHSGPKTLASLCREWGVEAAASPGGEVDSGLLQFGRVQAGNEGVMGTGVQLKEIIGNKLPSAVPRSSVTPRRSIGSSQSEEMNPSVAPSTTPIEGEQPGGEEKDTSSGGHSRASRRQGVTLQQAASSFVQALFGAHYLHLGLTSTKSFYNSHILSRHLDISSLFAFSTPTRDLSRLCAREDFMPPVARLLAETGRLSRHPVYVVGVFSGREKLGEGSGASLDEARVRAAVNALKGWYLYSPLDVKVPSSAKEGEPFEPCMIDGGEIVI